METKEEEEEGEGGPPPPFFFSPLASHRSKASTHACRLSWHVLLPVSSSSS